MTYARTEPTDQEPDIRARPPLVREFLLVAGLFLAYKFGRRAANGHVEEAFRNAGNVWDLERALRLPGEGAVQGVLLHSQTLTHAANTYYATVHFPATVLFLVWLYWRRPLHYLWSRRILAVLTGGALVLHLLFPLAPPRMLPAAALVDTGQVYGPTVYGATPATDTMANQFAAMPSLHVGWAVMVAVGLIVATRSRWRWLWLLHPAITLLVVVGTANHYWLDAIVVVALLAVAFAGLRLPRAARNVPAHLPWPVGDGAVPGGGAHVPAYAVRRADAAVGPYAVPGADAAVGPYAAPGADTSMDPYVVGVAHPVRTPAGSGAGR
ncbi:phosphatase PAP2 family protein [Streptomyces sp. CA-256286]|uniref:phosphatase PAP2 family protein n=1 Tax=Streptomyces sp. CA-256286 TaxID=2801033 RepID=UPI001A98684A|nr:phosphatase PAP2 family protein [Streptomyces sp. CA-256286]QTA36096.1 inositol phosphorylceramide synthase [Streptomyces sp. CA-256286]